jgi:hypothetical protein
MKLIDIEKLKELALNNAEIKKLCANKMPIYLLQMELERYGMKLDRVYYKQLDTLRLHFKK